ncbi:MAG: hypothetical protein E7536_06930 [Ruminococcaceae bacterium]|nr:hypothetical protein [Oscillospiraceae bacterium]
MLKTSVEWKNSKPYISVDGNLYPPMAYTTYFEECGDFSGFIKAGYRMFFINVSFTDLPINNITGFSPFLTGVFEKDIPDYSEFDNVVGKILEECPDALIFPRINVAMPRKWLEENPEETVETPTGKREALWSDLFLRDGAEYLIKLVSHIRESDYAHRIAGYQLCGGTTQEWMHHDMAGSFSEMGFEKFRRWMKETYNCDDVPEITKEDLFKSDFNEAVSRYGEFCSVTASHAVEYFAKALKEFINHEQIVGVFYGYNVFVNDYLLGLHGLRFIIDSPYIDFFSSPCCYDSNRKLGIDWGDMVPPVSLKIHNKLYFVECDIRTHLTKSMHSSRPGKCPENFYHTEDENGNKTVWSGSENMELSLSAIRKVFIHQLTKSSGVWWFDMWGGWYKDAEIMVEMKKMKEVAESFYDKKSEVFPAAETVMFIDEKAYLNNPRGSCFCHSPNETRSYLGNTGIPFDLCMTEDAEKVLHKYKAAIFVSPLPSESGKQAEILCKKLGIPYIKTTTEKNNFKEDELRNFLVSSSVHCYNAEGNVLYCGNGFLGLHCANDGTTKIRLPKKFLVKNLLDCNSPEIETDEILVDAKKYHTYIFELF